MDKKIQRGFILRLLIIFVTTNGVALFFANWLNTIHISYLVVIGANTLLFLLASTSLYMHATALRNSNPNVFVRSIMASMLVKVMVVIAALFVYLLAAGKSKNPGALFTGMGLYVVYSILEVRAALQLNSLKNGNN
jgi:hypothetical protein